MVRDLYNYVLPVHKIAQRPAGLESERSDARLLYACSGSGQLGVLRDSTVRSLPDLLREGDLMVFNNTKVLPSRFFVKRPRESEIEVLLVRPCGAVLPECFGEQRWEALARPMRKLKAGELLELGPRLRAEVLGRTDDGGRLVLRVFVEGASLEVRECLLEEGLMPIPPYIRGGRSDELDRNLYQTVFAEIPGSVAAPTAGLHFDDELFQKLDERGIERVYLTLHVGVASFLPVSQQQAMSEDVRTEVYTVAAKTRRVIREAKQEGRRVVAVGTTVVRALESWGESGEFLENSKLEGSQWQETRLFITPGHRFRVVDVLFTNFHQPGSTHLLLVAAFFGKQAASEVYAHALASEYRFLSYGDAMLLEREERGV